MGGLPDRWMKYKPMGKVIPGTRFIAFKTPLQEALCSSLQKDKRFTPQHIIDENPNISLIVDLTNTTRYYDKNVFQDANVSYVKIFCPGHVVPSNEIISQFFNSVDKFLTEHPNDETLIGVHCTHGVNRTGYFICKYMIDKMGRDPISAIKDVGCARGYPIERTNYLEDLKGEKVAEVPLPAKSDHRESERENWREAARRNDDRPRSYNGHARSSNDRGRSYSNRDRSDSRRVDRWRDTSRSNTRYDPIGYGARSRYGRQNRGFQRSPRGSNNFKSERPKNWNDRSRQPYSRNYSSDRYSQNGRPRNRSRYEDCPNRGTR